MPEEIIIPTGSIRTMKKDLGVTQGGKAGFFIAEKSKPVFGQISRGQTSVKSVEARPPSPLVEEAAVQKEPLLTEIKAKEPVGLNITAENFRKAQKEEEKKRETQIRIAAEAVEARKREQERIEQEQRALERKAREEQERKERTKREEEERKKLILAEAEKRKALILAEEEKKKAQILAEKARAEFENSYDGRKIVLGRKQEEAKAERTALQSEVQRSSTRVKNLNFAKTEILNATKRLKSSFKEIVDGERKIEEEARLIETKEAQAINPNTKKQIEEKRWKMEKRRREFEQKRWPWDDKLRNLEDKLEKIDVEIRDANFEKENVNKKQNELLLKEEKIRLELEKINIDEELKKMGELKNAAEAKKAEVFESLKKIEIDLGDIMTQEKIVEDEKRNVDEQERSIRAIEERRELEKQRWQIEEKRRDIEKKRWVVDEIKQSAQAQLKSAEERLGLIDSRMESLRSRADEINIKLGLKQPEAKLVQQSPEEEPKEALKEAPKNLPREETAPLKKELANQSEIKKNIGQNLAAINGQLSAEGVSKERQEQAMLEIENARKRIEALKREAAEARARQKPKVSEIAMPIEGKKAIEEAPTKEEIEESMGLENKDILNGDKGREELLSRIRSPLDRKEFGAGAEFYKNFEGIAQKEKKEVENRIMKNESIQTRQDGVVVPLAKKPSKGEKLWVRLFVVIFVITLLFANLTFWYWYFKIRNQTPIGEPNAVPALAPEASITPISPEISAPNSLIITENERMLRTDATGMRGLISEAIAEPQTEGQFRRLILINKNENNVFSIREFFGALGVVASEEFYQQLDDDFTLFIYSQNQGKRIGFINKMKNSNGFTGLMAGLEPNLLNDFRNFFSLIGYEGPAVASYFRDADQAVGYGGLNFRYQTLSAQDMGICYFISSDYFIFTSSWESMENTLKRVFGI